MRKKIIASILLILLLVPVLAGCMTSLPFTTIPDINAKPVDKTTLEKWDANDPTKSSFLKVLEDEKQTLYLHEQTTEFALVNKETGKVWYSNPQDEKRDLLPSFKDVFSVRYYDDDDNIKTYGSYLGAGLNNSKEEDRQVVWTRSDDGGFRLIYTLGINIYDSVCPEAISVESYEKYILNNPDLTDKERATVEKNFKLYGKGIGTEHEFEGKVKDFPFIEDFPAYLTEASGRARESIGRIFEKAGFTLELLYEEYENIGHVTENLVEQIIIALDYKLENGELVVSIPWGKDKDGNEEKWFNRATTKLEQVFLLEYFGTGTDGEEGQMLIPDGSGALINWNNGKSNNNMLSMIVYGMDSSLEVDEIVNNTENVYMPVFAQTHMENGVAKDSAFVIIEKGDSIANIYADVNRGAESPYNKVYSGFTYTSVHEESYGRYTTFFFQKQLPSVDVTLRIKPLTGENADYVGMAKAYQDYLVKAGKLKSTVGENKYGLTVDLMGSCDVTQSVVGIPTTVWLELTTYKDAQTILGDLKNNGVENLSAVYSAWANGGYRHNIMNGVSPIGSLGGKGELKNLFTFANENGIKVYPDADVQYASKNYDLIFDGFLSYSDAARTLNNTEAIKYEYTISTNESINNSGYYVLRHEKFINAMEGFLKSYDEYNNKFVSLEGLSNDVFSDFDQFNGITRDVALEKNLEAVKKAYDAGYAIMAHGANFYMLPYASDITNAPVSSSFYYITDYSVPFYHMVLHGYKTYATAPINTSDDYMTMYLRAIETGSNLNFEVMMAPNSAIKEIEYVTFYSMNYDLWRDIILELYTEAEAKLGGLQNKKIIDHEYITEDVVLTTYENGTKVYVNYSEVDYVDGELTVPARDFEVRGGNA